MDAMVKLANTLASKQRLDDDELGLYRALLAYIELHSRMAMLELKTQFAAEGITDEDLRGYSQTNN